MNKTESEYNTSNLNISWQQIKEFQEFQNFKQSKQYQDYQKQYLKFQKQEIEKMAKREGKHRESSGTGSMTNHAKPQLLQTNFRGINVPSKQADQPAEQIQDQEQNNFMMMSGSFAQQNDDLPNLHNTSSRTIEQQTLMFSIHTGGPHTESNLAPVDPSQSGLEANLQDYVSSMSRFDINDAKAVRGHYLRKGMRLFFELNENLNAYKKPFERQKSIKHNFSVPLNHLNGEKCQWSPRHEHDFRQWEQYDVLAIERQDGSDDYIQHVHLPLYIAADVSSELNPCIEVKNMTEFKCGLKIGSKLSLPSKRWVEKWFEVNCAQIKIKSSKQTAVTPQDVVIRCYSKIWVNEETNTLQGESATQIYIDGKKHNVEDALAFKLEEHFLCQNILLDFSQRHAKLKEFRCFVTEYDQSQFAIKVKEDGCEHKWTFFPLNLADQGLTYIKWAAMDREIVQSSKWQTLFQMDNQYVKETNYIDVVGKALQHSEGGQSGSTPKSSQVVASDEIGFKEGRNEMGELWKEDWQRNERAQYYRWNYWTDANKYGQSIKHGEWQEVKQGDYDAGEKWCEIYQPEGDYWEKKNHKYTNHTKNMANVIDVVIIKSGINEFRNNKGF